MTYSTREQLHLLINERAVIRGKEIKLSAGGTSQVYFDCRKLTLNAQGNFLVSKQLLTLIQKITKEQISFALGGPSIGADFIIPGIMAQANMWLIPPIWNGCVVRKEVKKHGMQSKVENLQPPGTNIVVVEDVITTGSSVIDACNALLEADNVIVAIAAIIDREAGGVQTLQEMFNCPVEALFKMSEFA